MASDFYLTLSKKHFPKNVYFDTNKRLSQLFEVIQHSVTSLKFRDYNNEQPRIGRHKNDEKRRGNKLERKPQKTLKLLKLINSLAFKLRH